MPELGVELQPGASLAELTSLGIGGTTDLLRINKHESIPDAREVCSTRTASRINFSAAARTCWLPTANCPGSFCNSRSPIPTSSSKATSRMVDAAADLGRTVTFCAKHDLGGMEGLIGVPGTVGGALRMNAGAYGMQIGTLRPRGEALPRRRPQDRNPAGAIKFLSNTGTLLLRLMI